VVMDGETFDFEPNQVTSIQFTAANDNETISVDGMLNSIPMTFNLGTGHYTVKLDPTQASDEILSPVTVNTTAGGTLEVQLAPTGNLNFLAGPVAINGSGAGSAVTFKIPNSMPNIVDALSGPNSGVLQLPNVGLGYSNFGTTSLQSYSGVLGQMLGHLTLVNGGAGNGFNAEVDTVTGPGSGIMGLDGGTLKYSSFSEVDDLVPAQSAKYVLSGKSPLNIVDGPFLNYSPTTSLQQQFPSALGGLRGGLTVPIDFANKVNVTIRAGGHNSTINLNTVDPAAGMTQMTIDPGLGVTSVNIAATAAAVATTVTNSGASGAVETVTLHSAAQGVQGILGSVSLTNPKVQSGATTVLVVDDTGDTNPQSAILNDTALYNLALGQISWDFLAGLTIDGGSGGNTFLLGSDGSAPPTTINTGAGDDTVTAQLYSMSNFNLTLDGGTGNNQLSVVAFSPQTVIKQTSPSLITGYTKGVFGYISHIQYANFANVTLNPVSNLPPLPGGSGPPPKGKLSGVDNFFLFM
jgi:hypothetical protein